MARFDSSEVDYIVVGAGSAGCVLANRLTEDKASRVLLLEAGGEDASLFIHVPAAFGSIGLKHNWMYTAEPDASRDGRTDKWSAGKVLGGSSSINLTVWTRGHRSDYDGWAERGCTGWGYEDVLPFFRRSETFVGGADRYRGGDGPVRVSFGGLKHRLADAFVETMQQMGYPYSPDLNGEHQEGVGYFQVSQRRGMRHSAARAYLLPARRRRNLKLVKHATVERILIENGRARGVQYRHKGRTVTVRARKEVILSAGALASPRLLMLSGIGPSEQLERLGIDVVADSPHVGQHLQEHAHATVMFGMNYPTLNMEVNLKGALKHGFAFIAHGTGGITTPVTSGAFVSPTGSGRPEFELVFSPIGLGPKESEDGADGELVQDFTFLKTPAVMASVWLCHPETRGTVSLRSARSEDPPVIRHELLGAESDVANLRAGCRLIRDIFAAEPLSSYVVDELAPGSAAQSDEDLTQYLRAATVRGEHASGTCRMGVEGEAVVDPELKVYGVEGLRVVDASVIPSLITGHTNAPTIMIAEKAASLIRS